MGVDWLSCERCGETFPDCGDFVSCNDDCYKVWCCDECAKEDGFHRASCNLGLDISSEGYLEDDRDLCPKAKNSNKKYIDCDGCENYTPTSCKYCRNEDYEDCDLLEKAMELLNCDRQYLINRLNE